MTRSFALYYWTNAGGSHLQMFFKICVIKNSAKFKEKQLCWSHLNLQLFQKVTPAEAYSCEFCEIFKNTFFTGHLQTTVSAVDKAFLWPEHPK